MVGVLLRWRKRRADPPAGLRLTPLRLLHSLEPPLAPPLATGRSSGRSRDHLVGCTHMLLTTELIIKLPADGLVWLTGLGLRH